jgi:uncharacterized membrane protein
MDVGRELLERRIRRNRLIRIARRVIATCITLGGLIFALSFAHWISLGIGLMPAIGLCIAVIAMAAGSVLSIWSD